MNVSEMLGSMGIVGMAVMVCLLVLSIYSVSVILGKYRRFKQSVEPVVAVHVGLQPQSARGQASGRDPQRPAALGIPRGPGSLRPGRKS